MNLEKFQFLSLRHLPGRFTVQETAWYLGFTSEDIPNLTKSRMLKPAGKPRHKATKTYPYNQLRRLRVNEPWISKATDIVYNHWLRKNQNKKTRKKRRS